MARLTALLATLVLLLAPAATRAQTPAGATDYTAQRAEMTKTLAEASDQLRQISRDTAKTGDDDDLSDLRGQALELQSKLDDAVGQLQARVTTLDGLVAQLGPAPASASAEPPTVRETRARLAKARSANDALLRQARLEATAARQTAERIVERRRTLFNQRLFTRAASPFSAELWTNIGENLPADVARLERLGRDTSDSLAKGARPDRLAILLGALLLAVVLIGPARLWLESLGRRRAEREAPSGALGRSGFAVWRVTVGTALPGLAAAALRLGLSWSDLLGGAAAEIADSAALLLVWIAFVAALGRAFLSADLPAWRLPPLSDRLARRLRPYPWVVAGVTAAGAMVERVNGAIGASLAATVAANCAISLAYAATAGLGLLIIGRVRLRELKDAGTPDAPASGLRSLVTVAVVLAVVLAFAAALLGYFALAYLIARQILWIGILACLLYLLLRFIDDAFTALLTVQSPLGRRFSAALGLRANTVEQLGVLGSAIVRVLLLFAAIGVVLAPFGAGGGDVLGRFAGLVNGVKIGGLTLSPLALATGVFSFLVGLWIVRAVKRWLEERYLPKTDWDAGVRASVSTTVGYVGLVIAIAWAAASMGLALQQIALIASALSVGIGFGLQAIVSNFISGLILLVERPVKVGDWVAVGDQEGDVRRINVRATEIAMFDRSTLIVPNSEFVTKTVRNVTLGGALGRVSLRFTLAQDADLERARALILEACGADKRVLKEPAPNVFVEAVSELGVVTQTYAYVPSPRDAYSTRSALYFDVLARFRATGIGLAKTSTEVTVNLDQPPPPRAG